MWGAGIEWGLMSGSQRWTFRRTVRSTIVQAKQLFTQLTLQLSWRENRRAGISGTVM